MAFDYAYWTVKITAIDARITALETAQLDLASGAIEEYTLDTGQSTTRIVKTNQETLQDVLNALYAQLEVFYLRRDGGGSVQCRSAF